MTISSFDAALEKAGYGRFQKKLLWVCGFGWAADAMEVMLVSFAMPSMAVEWNLTSSQKGFLSTAIFLGMFLGSIFWGRLSDKIGRKVGFILTIAFDSLFGLASAFSPNFIIFLLLRTLTGFGVGGTLPVDYALFSEYLPAKNRGRYLVMLESFWAFGTIAAAGLSWLVVPLLGWRALFVVSALPGLVLFVVRRTIPESPKFLASQGKNEDAQKIINYVVEQNTKSSHSNFKVDEIKNSEVIVDSNTNCETIENKNSKASGHNKTFFIKELFSKELATTTILLWIIWFAISIGYYGAFTWLPSWLRSKGFPLPSVYPYSFITALFQLPGYFSAAWFVEKIGRRKTLGVYMAGSSICAIAFGFANSMTLVVIASCTLSFFALGAWGALYAYTPEAYPTSIRTTGIGAASSMTRLAGIIAPSIGVLASGNNIFVSMLIFAIAYAVGSISGFILPKETMSVSIE